MTVSIPAWPLQKLLAAATTLVLAVAVLFALVVAAPGDPIDLVGDDAVRPQLTAEFGYDHPPAVRLAQWGWGAVRGDLGTSRVVRPGAAVGGLLAQRGPVSVATLWAATALLAVAGTALALATRGRRPWVGGAISVVSSPPGFLLAFGLVTSINALTWAAIEAGVVGRPGWFALPDQPSALRFGLGVLVLAVGSGALSQVHAQLEDHFVRLGREPWVDAARGRGDRLGGLLVRATLPVVAEVLGDRAALLAGSLVVVEKVLLVPGLGSALFDAAAARDYDLVCATAVLATMWVVGVRALAGVIRSALDPRLTP